MKMKTFLFLLAISFPIFAQDIVVKYRVAPVDVSNGNFEYIDLKSSSFVHEIYYDEDNQYLLVRLKQTFYHYCEIPKPVVSEWVNADSIGGHYIQKIKGNFDCRINFLPDYCNKNCKQELVE